MLIAESLAGLSFKEFCDSCHTTPFIHGGQFHGDWTCSVPSRMSPEGFPSQWH